MIVRFAETALNDSRSICDFVAAENPLAADRPQAEIVIVNVFHGARLRPDPR